jgi:hypothetical protein
MAHLRPSSSEDWFKEPKEQETSCQNVKLNKLERHGFTFGG